MMKIIKPKRKITNKIRDSFSALADEYMVSIRWREHFMELFDELDDNWKKEKGGQIQWGE